MIKNSNTKASNNNNRRRRAGRRNGKLPPENLTQAAQFAEPTTVAFPRNVIGFPDRLCTILKYAQNYNNAASATPSAQVWALNSAFDPDNSGVGHQPSYFDTFAAIYGRYFVKAFKMEMVFSQAQTATVPTEWVALYSDVNTSPNTVEQLIESKYAVNGILALPTAGGCVKKVSLPWMSSAKLMGQPFTEADDNMYSAVSASPGDTAWGIVKVQAQDGATNVACRVRATIYMEIVFKDLLTQVSS